MKNYLKEIVESYLKKYRQKEIQIKEIEEEQNTNIKNIKIVLYGELQVFNGLYFNRY